MVTFEKLINEGRIKVDPTRNDFPVTLHDPCNLVRLMGIVSPQRRSPQEDRPPLPGDGIPTASRTTAAVAVAVSPSCRVTTSCDWRAQIAGRKKLEQVLNAFKDELDPSIKKYLCAPCSNCKGQFRDVMAYYNVWEKHSILYDGLAELIVNCMIDVKPGFIEWEWH